MAKLGKLALLTSARRTAQRHAGSVHHGIDKVASMVRSRTGDRHADKVDKGASLLKRITTGTDAPQEQPATG